MVDGITFGCNVFDFQYVAPAPVNQAPVAQLTATAPDADGTVTSRRSPRTTAPPTPSTWTTATAPRSTAAPRTTGRSPTTYAPGTYTAILTVTDAEGLSDTDSETFTVTAPVVADTQQGTALPNTGANVLGLAVIGGVAVAGAGSGLVLRNRRRSTSAV